MGVSKNEADLLQKRVEELLSKNFLNVDAAESKSVRELLHELAVYQAELELQNEELRQAQLALQNARDQFADLYEHAPVGYVILDRFGIIRRTNATWRVMLNCENDDFRGRPFSESIVPEDVSIFLGRFRAFFRNPLEKQIEVRLLRKDGDPLHVRIEAKPRLNDSGRSMGALPSGKESEELMVIVSDITESKQAEEAFKKSSELLRGLFENMSSGAAIYEVRGDGTRGRDYIIRDFNRTSLEIEGMSRDEVIGKSLFDLRPTIDDYGLIQVFRKVWLTGEPAFFPSTLYVDGKYANWYENRVFKLPTGEIVAIYDDVTERHRAEEAVRESELRFRLIAELAPVGIVISDINEKTLYVSPKFVELFGYTLEDMPDVEAWWPLAYPDEAMRESVRRKWGWVVERAVAGNGEIPPLEYPVRCKDGTVRWIEFRIAGGGGINIIVFTDISDRREAEVERGKLHAQLQQAQKMESVGRLAGGVAHDFNNKLGVILGHVDMALEEVEQGSTLHEHLTEIGTAAQLSADLTRQLLAFARKQTIAPKVVDLNIIVGGMLKMLQRLIGEDIELSWVPGRGVETVKVDPSQIDQILANLCVNARDAISGVGMITIGTDRAVFDEDYCAVHAGAVPGDYVLLAVSDNGCGMDRDTLDRLFEPFFTTKAVGKGTGLGLATVYSIVKQNNGYIDVYSEPGRGTTVKMYFPVHHGEQVVEGEIEVPMEKGDETILVVEDDPGTLNMTVNMIQRLGYMVISAGSPADAVGLFRDHSGSVDLLLTDVVMPEMNGRGLADTLQALHPGLRVLFMSGYTADVIAPHGVLDPGVHFIQKPFVMKELAACIRRALTERISFS